MPVGAISSSAKPTVAQSEVVPTEAHSHPSGTTPETSSPQAVPFRSQQGAAGTDHDAQPVGTASRTSPGSVAPSLRVREEGPALAFPEWTLDLAAIRRPEGREAHAGNAVPVRTVCLTAYDSEGFAHDAWCDL